MRTVLGVFLLVMIYIVGCASQFVKPRQTVRNAEMTGKEDRRRQPLVGFEQTDLFVSGTEGYHTFRIPALAVTKNGTLLAFCEGRKHGRGDSGAIDTVLRRSTDNGHSWGPLQVVGVGGEDTCGNPCPIVERRTGAVLLLLTKNKGAVNESMIMRGEAPPRTVWIARSMDDGVTWSALEEISEQAREPEWRWYATGPGHGIQLANGRLVAPCDHSLGLDGYSHVIYSDDAGASWRIGGVATVCRGLTNCEGKTDESTVVELFTVCRGLTNCDGTLYLNMRNNRGTHRRAFATSTDKGLTWSPVGEDPTLVEPVCQASVLSLSTEKDGAKNRIVFSNPASERRENMTVRLSYDECKTWPVAKTLWSGPSAYSDLVLAADKRIGCLYERGRDYPYETVTFALLTLEWLTEGRDAL